MNSDEVIRYFHHVQECADGLLRKSGGATESPYPGLEVFCKDLANETQGPHAVRQVIGIGDCVWLAGGDASDWRPWYSLAAWGFHLIEEPEYSRIFAALSGEWTFLDMVASRNATTWGRIDVRSFEVMLGLSDIQSLEVPSEMLIQLSAEGYYDLSRDQLLAWLAKTEQDQSHELSLMILQTLAEDWLEDQGSQPRDAFNNPGWDWVVSAMVSFFNRQGVRFDGLSTDVRRYLGPGLLSAQGLQILPALV